MALSSNYSLVSNIMKWNNPCDILGCGKTFTRVEIDKCYKWTMSRVHPDKNCHPLATKAAQKVNLSRDILLNSIDSDKIQVPASWSTQEVVTATNVKFFLLAVCLILAAWSVHITVYLLADEWSLRESAIHRVARTTPLIRIEYFVQSRASASPSEQQVVKELMLSIVDSCKNHLRNDPWYGLLYLHPDDPCTRGKIAVVYAVLFVLIVRFFYRFFFKKKTI